MAFFPWGIGMVVPFSARVCLGRYKKAGRFPMRTSVGPAKNPLPERQRIAQQDAKAQCFLRVFLVSGSKNLIKFGGFTDVFC